MKNVTVYFDVDTFIFLIDVVKHLRQIDVDFID